MEAADGVEDAFVEAAEEGAVLDTTVPAQQLLLSSEQYVSVQL